MSKKWIKVNWVDQMIFMGDEEHYWHGFYCSRYAEYLKHGGKKVVAADEGWDGYTYEQGRGLFRWKNGGKEFISYEWSAGDSYLTKIDLVIKNQCDECDAEEERIDANVVKDIAAAEQLTKDITELKKRLDIS